MKKKLTIKEIQNGKGKQQFSEVHVKTIEEARACEAAGIDILITEKEVEMCDLHPKVIRGRTGSGIQFPTRTERGL